MLPTLIIGLREGLEAALIVGIVAAFLRKEGRSDALRQVWYGVSLAVLICLGVGIGLQVASRELGQRAQEGLETVVGLIAVGMVTYMVVWMKRNSRDLKKELEGAARSALAANSAQALVLMAFLAVLREGFETAVLVVSAFNQTNVNKGLAGAGAVIGVAIAVAIGYGIYRGGVKINLSRFFRVTGFVLVLVAAGLLATAALTAAEAGWINVGQAEAFDISAVVRQGTVLESLLTGMLGWQAHPTVLAATLYFLYLVPLGVYVVWPQKVRAAAGRVAGAARPDPIATSRPQLALRAVVAVVVLGGAGAIVTTVGSTKKADANAPGTVTVTLADAGCSLSTDSISAGATTFLIENAGTSKFTETELLAPSGQILAERENVVRGQSASFVYSPTAGTYAIQCGVGTTKHPITVTGASGQPTAGGGTVARQLAAATAGYVTYVQDNVAQLQTATKVLTDAVRAGDLAAAQAAYPVARVYYERIEPVAESFGDLDPAIDNRIDDAGSLAQLTGFHRLEYAMWQDRSLAGMAPVATQLDADVAKLRSVVATVTFQPAQLANGATSLLDEVGKTKITGEEERYSHVDFVDLAANVEGAQDAFSLLKPALQTLDPTLAAQTQARFDAVDQLLATYRTGSAPSDYRSYSTVPDATRKQISQAIDALAGPLSKVAGAVASG